MVTPAPSQSEMHCPRIWVNATRRGPSHTGPSGNPSPVASTVCVMAPLLPPLSPARQSFSAGFSACPDRGGPAYVTRGRRRARGRGARRRTPMRLLVPAAALLLALFARPAASADTFQVVAAFQREDAFSLIIVPQSWNGAFIVYAHGYDADYRDIVPYPSDITPANIGSKLSGADLILQIPLTLGYAVGTTTYRSVGWAVA